MRVRQFTFAFVLSATTSHPSAWSVPASSHLALAGRRSGTGHVDDFHGRGGEAPWISKVVHAAPVPSQGTCVLLSSEDSSRRILRFADPRVHVRGLHPAVSALLRRSRSSSILLDPSLAFPRTFLPAFLATRVSACEARRRAMSWTFVASLRPRRTWSHTVPLPLSPSQCLSLSHSLSLNPSASPSH